MSRVPRRPRAPERVLSESAAYAVMGACVVIFASAFAGIRYMLDHMQAMPFTAARLAVATVGMLTIGVIARIERPARVDLPQVATAGLCGFTLYHVALNFGATSITAGQAAFIASTIPVWTAFVAWRFLGERIAWRHWIGLAVSLGGVGLMSLTPGEVGLPFGSLLVLLAAMFASGNIVLQKQLLERYRATDLAVWACVFGSAPLIAWLPTQRAALAMLGVTEWAVIGYLGIVPIGLGYWASNFALKVLPAYRTAQMLLFIPPVAALIAWLVLGEVPTTRLMIGGVLILAGVALSVRRRPALTSGRQNTRRP